MLCRRTESEGNKKISTNEKYILFCRLKKYTQQLNFALIYCFVDFVGGAVRERECRHLFFFLQ